VTGFDGWIKRIRCDMKAKIDLKPLVISAPFGNYIQPDFATATMGTFTAARRGGVFNRLWRMGLTMRYYWKPRAWVNKIGLRNPGIDWVVDRVKRGKLDVSDKIISVHGFVAEDWWKLFDRVASLKPLAMELNISCPNVGHISWPADLFSRAVDTGVTVILKLPPVNFRLAFDAGYASGIGIFHCCNTLPVPCGGMSGRPLKPIAIQCIGDLVGGAGGKKDITIIGGGGILTGDDVKDYRDAGADYFAVGAKLMSYQTLGKGKGLLDILEKSRVYCSDRLNAN